MMNVGRDYRKEGQKLSDTMFFSESQWSLRLTSGFSAMVKPVQSEELRTLPKSFIHSNERYDGRHRLKVMKLAVAAGN